MRQSIRLKRLKWPVVLLLVANPIKSKGIWEEDAGDSYEDAENSMRYRPQDPVRDEDKYPKDKLQFKLDKLAI